MSQQWPLVVTALAEESLELLNLMDDYLDRQSAAGAIHPGQALVLRRAMKRMKDASHRAQQVTRIASGRIRQNRERIDMAHVVQQVLEERAADCDKAHVVVRSEALAMPVLLDSSLAFGVVNSLVDWILTFGAGAQFRIGHACPPSTRPRLEVEVARRQGGREGQPQRRRLNDGLQWVLLRQLVASAGLEVQVENQAEQLRVQIDFPTAFVETDGLMTMELQPERRSGSDDDSVLVISPDARVLATARQLLANIGFSMQEASTGAEAAQWRTLRPAAVVLAEDARGGDFDDVRSELLSREGPRPLIELTRQRRKFHLSGFQGSEIPVVALEDLEKELAATLLFELAKSP